MIYNTHFTGSPLWNLFCREADMVYNSWNRSIRIMFDLPLSTHRYFLEHLAGTQHLKAVLIKRFLNFIQQIEKSPKTLPNLLLKTIRRDCRSTTGSNLRNILLLTQKSDISELIPADAYKIPVNDDNR